MSDLLGVWYINTVRAAKSRRSGGTCGITRAYRDSHGRRLRVRNGIDTRREDSKLAAKSEAAYQKLQ